MPSSAPALLAVGETMALVTPARPERLAVAEELRLDIGGAESNVACHVAALGHPTEWFSRLGADALGERILATLARRGVDVDRVVIDDGAPTGLYLKDPGHGVLYHRAGSAASRLSTADADALDLRRTRILHASGITCALGAGPASFFTRIVARARAEGLTVSFDVNHRAPLWSAADAAEPLRAAARTADIVFVGLDEARILWGCADAAAVRTVLPDVPVLVVKDAEVGATEFAGDESVFVPALSVDVVEPVGAGDAFAGGYLAAWLSGAEASERLQAGHARAALTLTTTNDYPEETP